jgi:ELWxxDGT repeat protein
VSVAESHKEEREMWVLQGRFIRPALGGFLLAGLIALGSGASGAPGDVTVSQVADIRPGMNGSNPQDLFNAGGTLLFKADDGTNGTELWRSNGGPIGGGTEMVEIASGSADSNPTEFADVNGTVFFRAADGIGGPFHGNELWKIAPPFTSPFMVDDISPGSSSNPKDLANANGTLLFNANDGSSGEELWKSVPPYDAASTDLAKNINTGAGTGSFPGQMVNVNGTVFFDADDGTGDDLWKSASPYDSSSTTKVDVNPSGDSFPGPFVNVGNTLFFAADDGSGDGFELFKLDPPYTTPVQVEDINPSGDSDPAGLINVNGILFFKANDGNSVGQHGEELWKSVAPFDAASTNVLDINTGPSSSDPFDLSNVGGTLFLRAGDGVHGQELWKSNGGPVGAGTDLAADINPTGGSFPSQITDVSGSAFFQANDGMGGGGLWRSSGTGASPVTNLFGTSSLIELTNVAGTLFFGGTDDLTGFELWKATVEGPAATVSAPPAAGAVAGPTGQRAAALKKCKKKKSKKARKKCRKKAKRLPI